MRANSVISYENRLVFDDDARMLRPWSYVSSAQAIRSGIIRGVTDYAPMPKATYGDIIGELDAADDFAYVAGRVTSIADFL